MPRILAELDRSDEGRAAATRALALLEQGLGSDPDNIDLLRTRGEVLASRGEWDRAAADLARFFAADKDKAGKSRWLVAGTWVVGPYPFDTKQPARSLAASFPPPESDPTRSDPSRMLEGKSMLAWKIRHPRSRRSPRPGPLIQPRDQVFAYVLTESTRPRIATSSP